MSEPILSIRNLTVRFGSVVAIDDVTLDVQPGEIFSLLGPSGCGKSTLLRAISGFESPSEGEILLDGEDITRIKPNRRPLNMVFQSYAVFPHMSVFDNVAYGLKMEGTAGDETDRRVNEALEMVHLTEQSKRKPDQLSGGQRQRVALARALVKRPRILLLDEPLSALDAKLRDQMRLELIKLQESVGITFVLVTHDQDEAMALSDRIAVLDGGRLRQIATPRTLYQEPVDAFVADFIGRIHAFDIEDIERVQDDTVALHVSTLGRLDLPASRIPDTLTDEHADETRPGIVAIRPEHIRLSLPDADEPLGTYDTPVAGGDVANDSMVDTSDDTVTLQGELGDVAFQGQYAIVECRLGHRSLTAVVGVDAAARLQAAGTGSPIYAHWRCEDMLVLPHRAPGTP